MNELKYIVIHCSASPFGNAALITKWHINGRGWSNIGYHKIILNGQISEDIYNERYDGHIETGRPFDTNNRIEQGEIGAHVLGINKESMGICLIGNPHEGNDFTKKQLESLESEIYKMQVYHPQAKVMGHYQFDDNKPHCPGIDIPKFLEDYQLTKRPE